MFLKDLKLIFSDRKMFILLTLLVALSVAGIFFCVKETRGPAVKLGIVDEDQTEYSALLVTYFDNNEVFSSYFQVVRGTREELKEKFEKGELDMIMIIPDNFTENIQSINNVPIETVINRSDTTKAILLKNFTEAYSNYITAAEINCQALVDIMRREGYSSDFVHEKNVSISIDLVLTALGKDSLYKRKTIERFEGISLINYYIYSGLILLILYAGLFAGLKALKERLGQAGKRLISAGVGKGKIFLSSLFSFLLVYGVIMLISVGLITGLGELSIPPVAILFILVAIAISCILFMLISGFVKSVSAYMILGNMLILFATIAGGGIIPIMYLPEGCIAVARFTPTYWFLKLIL